MIRRADDIARVIEVYNAAFPGEEKFCKWYFDTLWTAERTLVHVENNVTTAAVQDLPLKLKIKGREYSGAYIFAAGTRPEYRGRGIMAALLEESFRQGTAAGLDFSALIAEEHSLLDYYKRFGYTVPVSVCRKETDYAVNAAMRPCRKEDLPSLQAIYEQETKNQNAMVRDIRYYEIMLELYGESLSVTEDENGAVQGYCFRDIRNGVPWGTEVMGKVAAGDCAGFWGAGTDNLLQIGAVKPLSRKAAEAMAGDTIYMNILFN